MDLSTLTIFVLQDWACLSHTTQELSRGPNVVQTSRATPTEPANMVGVCSLSQVLIAESLNCFLSISSAMFPACSTALPLLLSLPLLMPLNFLPYAL